MRTIRSLVSVAAICLLSCFALPDAAVTALAYDTIEAQIPVTCQGLPDDKTHVYQIIIEAESDLAPAPTPDHLNIAENETGEFTIKIDQPGSFLYRVYELSGDDPEIEYDTNTYEILIYVEAVSDTALRYAVSATADAYDSKAEGIAFANAVLSYTDVVTTTSVTTAYTDDASSEPEQTTTIATTDDFSSDVQYTTRSTTDDVSSDVQFTTVATTGTASSDDPHSTAGSTTVLTTVTTTTPDTPVTHFMENVLTGDSFPAHTVRIVMLSSVLIAFSALLFKRDHSEEEDKNDE